MNVGEALSLAFAPSLQLHRWLALACSRPLCWSISSWSSRSCHRPIRRKCHTVWPCRKYRRSTRPASARPTAPRICQVFAVSWWRKCSSFGSLLPGPWVPVPLRICRRHSMLLLACLMLSVSSPPSFTFLGLRVWTSLSATIWQQ